MKYEWNRLISFVRRRKNRAPGSVLTLGVPLRVKEKCIFGPEKIGYIQPVPTIPDMIAI